MVLSVVLGPGIPAEIELAGSACVVIDVLRFTTTLTAALEAGAKVIYPVGEPEDAWRLQRQLGDDLVLGGERGGLRINGFDLGNSPREYTPPLVAGRILALTTSNGTKALHDVHQAGAAPVYAGCLRNAPAVARRLLRAGKDAVMYCAGTGGKIALEDVVGAGAIVHCCAESGRQIGLTDTARLALAAFEKAGAALADKPSAHARRLIELGFVEDVLYSSMLGASEAVGEFDGVMIRPASHSLRRGM
jgi:2-phosphosulfolactate phosphatase